MAWIAAQLAAGPILASGVRMRYAVLLPVNFNPARKCAVLVWMHTNGSGNRAYPNSNAVDMARIIGADGWFNNPTFQARYPDTIVVCPACDQTTDFGGAHLNFGGYGEINAANEQSLPLVAMEIVAKYNADPARLYAAGGSLGGHGSWGLALDHNAYNGKFSRTFAAFIPEAGMIVRSGVQPQNVLVQLHGVPIFAVHGAGDGTSPPGWDRGIWDLFSGGKPRPGAPGARAGDSQFHYLEDQARGHDVWDTYTPNGAGRPIYDWLFAQSATGIVVVPPQPPFVPAGPPSLDNTLVTAGGSLIDKAGHTWTITSDGRVAVDGVADPLTANVVALAWCSGVLWQQNATAKWYNSLGAGAWAGGGLVSPMPGQAPPGGPVSPDNTLVTGGGSLTDAGGHIWTITLDGRVAVDGVADPLTANVIALAWCSGVLWQQNQANKWYNSLGGGAWAGGTLTSPMPGANPPDPPPVVVIPPPTTGPSKYFHVANGKIFDPDGREFLGVGFNINDSQMGTVTAGDPMLMLKYFPGTTMLRIACRSYAAPDYYRNFINKLTAKKIVMKFEDHSGISKPPYVGPQLTAETQWYGNLAAAFKDNPYVWFGGFNEPGRGVALQLIQAQNAAIYKAIRATSDTIFAVSLPSGGNRGLVGPNARGYDGSIMGGLDMVKTWTGVIWDLHNYGWLSNYNTDPAVIRATMLGIPPAPAATGAAAAQLWLSADGKMPVMIGEFGNSTTGTGIDANGIALCEVTGEAARKREIAGYQAWHWNAAGDRYEDQLVSDAGQMTSLGKLVARLIATSGA